MKRCSKCMQRKEAADFGAHRGSPDGLARWCRVCRSKHRAPRSAREKAYNKAYLAAHPECTQSWQKEFPERRAAHVTLGNAVRDGRVRKTACMVCGAEKVEGHHADYSRPLDVVWLCKQHHAECHTLVAAMPVAQPQADFLGEAA